MAQTKSSSGVQITYDDKRASPILHHMLELIRTMDRLGLAAGFQISAPLHVLGTQLSIRGISDEHLMRQLIFTAAINLKSIHEPTLSQIMDAVGAEAHRYLERPVQEYHVLLPLNVEQRLLSTIQTIEVGGITFLVDNWPNAQDRYV